MKTNEKKNTSAKKKLIPAVAMLTTSAVMLSTATYAWFTMNKDAEVTGLNMTATAGGSIEISLGQIDNASGLPVASASDPDVVKTPDMSNKSWKNVIAVSDYYSSIAKPVSSLLNIIKRSAGSAFLCDQNLVGLYYCFASFWY